MSDETTVMNMYDYNRDHYEMYCRHGKTMLMMYQVTNETRYLIQARLDYHLAKSLQEQRSALLISEHLAA